MHVLYIILQNGRDLLADWEDSASSRGGSPGHGSSAPVAMDVDGEEPPAAAAASPLVDDRAQGAAPAPDVERARALEDGVSPKGETAAEDCGATRRGLQRRSGGSGAGDSGYGEAPGAGHLRHPSRSPPKKVPRWRGRTAGGGRCAGCAGGGGVSAEEADSPGSAAHQQYRGHHWKA